MSRTHLPSPLTPATIAATALTALLAGCQGQWGTDVQSALHPAGRAAESIESLWWFLCILLTAVFAITLLLLGLALLTRPNPARPGPPLGPTRFVVLSGIALPALILVVLLFASVTTTVALRPPEPGLTIRVVGHRWWWEVHYPDLGIDTANELHIPVGVPVRIELEARDVIHSFWAPNLAGKMDLVPGGVNVFWLQADRPGTFRGQCAEYCGIQHALMGFYVVALPPDEFDAWARRMLSPPTLAEAAPDPPLAERGRELFFSPAAGCYACHAIKATPAVGDVGPDLTHMGSRLSIGAATLPNTSENLAKWILNPQAFKPGNLMPATPLAADDLDALVAYLESLE